MAKSKYSDIQINRIGDRRDKESQKHRKFWYWGTVFLVLLAIILSFFTGCGKKEPPDTEPPVIQGVHDITVQVGEIPSYREGIEAVDNKDGSLLVEIDAHDVLPDQPGQYTVLYSAVDAAGNRAEEQATVTVEAPPEPVIEPEPPAEPQEPANGLPSVPDNVSESMIADLADGVLAQITDDSMTLYDKADAIWHWCYKNIKYVGTSDKSDWLIGAYVGFTYHKGDCFNYFATAKALLNQAGIPNIDLRRVGGTTQHFWNLVNVGNGWYHFDTCWHPAGYNIYSFMMTEQEARDYTALLEANGVRLHYFTYDYTILDQYGIEVVGTPHEELQEPGTEPAEEPTEPVTEPAEETVPEGEAPADTGAEEETVPAESPSPDENTEPDAEAPAAE